MSRLVAFVIHHQILSDGAGGGAGSLLEVLWVKHKETSVMGGDGVITPMTHLASSTTHVFLHLLRHPETNQASGLMLSLNATRSKELNMEMFHPPTQKLIPTFQTSLKYDNMEISILKYLSRRA